MILYPKLYLIAIPKISCYNFFDMFRLILLVIVVFFILKLTTFGWQGLIKSPQVLPRERDLIGRLRKHVVKLSYDIGDRSAFKYDKLTQACDYISEQFKESGLEVEFQEYPIYEKRVKNIIAKKIGKTKPKEIIIVGAHYDTCFNPGANDNASGLAALLELAKLIAPREYSRTIKFIAFVNEEPPFFKTGEMGSLIYARAAWENHEDIKIAVILETIGYYSDKLFSQRYPTFLGPFYPNRANFIAIVGNFSARQWVREIAQFFRQHSSFPIRSAAVFECIPGVDFSDHWSFWQVGYPAVMITDTAFYRYSHYHSNSDTFEKINYDSLAAVVEGLEGVLAGLAEQ